MDPPKSRWPLDSVETLWLCTTTIEPVRGGHFKTQNNRETSVTSLNEHNAYKITSKGGQMTSHTVDDVHC